MYVVIQPEDKLYAHIDSLFKQGGTQKGEQDSSFTPVAVVLDNNTVLILTHKTQIDDTLDGRLDVHKLLLYLTRDGSAIKVQDGQSIKYRCHFRDRELKELKLELDGRMISNRDVRGINSPTQDLKQMIDCLTRYLYLADPDKYFEEYC